MNLDVPETVSPTEETTASAGSIFKRCREFQGMTLNDAAEATKIDIDYLKALEDNSSDKFANMAYLKGFVRIYSTTLGLNPDDMIRLYNKTSTDINSAVSTTSTINSTTPKKKFRIPFQKLILPSALLILLLITSAIMDRIQKPATIRGDSVKTAPNPNPAPQAQPVISSAHTFKSENIKNEKIDEEQTEKTPDAALSQTAKETSENVSGFVLSIKAIKNCELTVTVDSGVAERQELTAGDQIEWQTTKEITLEISNPSAIEIFRDGKQIPTGKGEEGGKNITIRAE